MFNTYLLRTRPPVETGDTGDNGNNEDEDEDEEKFSPAGADEEASCERTIIRY